MNYNLQRFIDAQNGIYEKVKKELEQGCKTSHWMWFIFPQIQGLGYSETAKYYSIRSLDEAKEYLNHSILGSRLTECSQIILDLENKTAKEIFGTVDAMKLRSSMTLFSLVSDNQVFDEVISMYFNGKKDDATLRIVGI